MKGNESIHETETLQWQQTVRLCNRFNLCDMGRIYAIIFIVFFVLMVRNQGYRLNDWAALFKLFAFLSGMGILVFLVLAVISYLFPLRMKFEVSESGVMFSYLRSYTSLRDLSLFDLRSLKWGQVRDLVVHPGRRVITLKTNWSDLQGIWGVRLYCTEENFPAVRDAAQSLWQSAKQRELPTPS